MGEAGDQQVHRDKYGKTLQTHSLVLTRCIILARQPVESCAVTDRGRDVMGESAGRKEQPVTIRLTLAFADEKRPTDFKGTER